MPFRTRLQLLFACAGCLLIGWLIGQNGTSSSQAKQATAMVEAPVFPMQARLGANLYLQTSAEYQACCLQIYRWAEQQLVTLVKAVPAGSDPAVVMDLDETVFDNSAFQTFLYRENLEYNDELWMRYEDQHPQDVRLIPGAKQFIARAEALGVTVVLLSNRSVEHQAGTIAALERLGLRGVDLGKRLLLKPKDGSSNKNERRAAAAAHFHIVMYVGDNLRDFSDVFAAPKLPADATPAEFAKAIAARSALVEKEAAHWGVDWIVIPNPVYGEWEKLIGPDPQQLFHPTSMPAPEQ